MGGGFLFDLLTLPVLGAPRLVQWIGNVVKEEVEKAEPNESQLQGQLLDLQGRYELGELEEQEYVKLETEILERLSALRQAQEHEG